MRASTLVICGILIISFLSFWVFVAKQEVIIIAPAYSVGLNLITKTQLSVGVEIIVSESTEALLIDKVYAIPIVSIQSSNSSFEAPLSSRFLSLNASDFMVLETGQYLCIRLTKTYVETSVYTNAFNPIAYDQTDNAQFSYQGFFRDAEIFFYLEKFAYDKIITLSMVSLQGFTSVVQKSIFASNSTGSTVLVNIGLMGETSIWQDTTTFTSLNEDFINKTIFLIKQTKLQTTCIKHITNATAPFRILSDL